MLDRFSIPYEVAVASAHRAPDRVTEFVRRAEDGDVRLIIAAAGHAAHLAGVVAAQTTLPVVGVPIPSSDLQGLDSLLAMVQMPGGVPVGTMAIGKPGAKNAALLAAAILGNKYPEYRAAYEGFREKQTADGVAKQEIQDA